MCNARLYVQCAFARLFPLFHFVCFHSMAVAAAAAADDGVVVFIIITVLLLLLCLLLLLLLSHTRTADE